MVYCMSRHVWWVWGLGILLLGACRAKKAVVVAPPQAPVIEEKKDPSKEQIRALDQQLSLVYPSFDQLSMKLHGNYQDTHQKLPINASMRLKKDSLIWISVTPLLGIEAFRILIRPDSAFVLNRIQSQYACYSHAELVQKLGYPVSISMLQNILLGRPAMPLAKLQNARLQQESTLRHQIDADISTQMHNKSYIYSLWCDTNPRVTQQRLQLSGTDQQALVIFENVLDVLSKNNTSLQIPKNIRCSVQGKDRISMECEYSKVESKPCEFPFSVPAKYERVKY